MHVEWGPRFPDTLMMMVCQQRWKAGVPLAHMNQAKTLGMVDFTLLTEITSTL